MQRSLVKSILSPAPPSFKGSIAGNIKLNYTPEEPFWILLLKVYWQAVPSSLTLFFIFLHFTVNLIFIGELNDYKKTAAAGLAHVMFNAFATCPLIALNCGFLNVASQVFGAKQLDLLGKQYQAIIIIDIFFAFLSTLLMYLSKYLLVLTGVEDQIVDLTHQYVLIMIPAIFAFFIQDATRQLLISQNHFDFQLKVYGVTTGLHILWNWLFVSVADLGFEGPPLAKGLTEVLTVLLIFAYIIYSGEGMRTWQPWSKDSFAIVWKFFCIVFPMAMSVYVEWLAFEIMSIMASFLGDLQLAIFTLYANVLYVVYMIPMGFAMTFGTLLGNAIGEGDHKRATTMIRVGYAGTIIIEVIIGAGLYFFAESIAGLYSSDRQVLNGYVADKWIISVYGMSDGICCMHSTMLRMIGHEKFAMWTYMICFYVIGILFAWLVVFQLEWVKVSAGLLMGYVVGEIVLNIVSAVKILTTDLKVQCALIGERVNEDTTAADKL